MKAILYKQAVFAAQRIMSESDGSLVLDGKWGTHTQKTFDGLKDADKDRVLEAIRPFGATPASLYRYRQQQKAENFALTGGDQNLVDPEDAIVWTTRSARQLGIKEAYIPSITEFLKREPAKRKVGSKVFYVASSQNGSSRGLGQLQPAAWKDAQRVDPSLPGYEMVYDPKTNLQAMTAYVKWQLDRWPKNVPVTGNNLYLAYNQGLGFLTKGTVTGLKGQSKEVQRMISGGLDR